MKRSRSAVEESAIRAQLVAELRNKKQCAFEPYECTELSIDKYNYCSKHILSDINAPFKQCTYIYQINGKKCNLPAGRNEKKEFSYCSEHALKSNLSNNRKNSKCPPPPTAESILNSLNHYIKPLKESHSGDNELKFTQSIDPFVDIDANAISISQCNEVLDLCSESESDIEPSTYASVWHDVNFDSSDNESIDSEDDDPLKHANVYTAEEISSITKDKLVRLQSLYIEQYRYLQYLLKEKRRKYLHALKREKETCCSIYNQVHDNPKEQRLYSKLKQFKKYHRTYGTEAVLAKKLRELRTKVTDGTSASKVVSYQKCAFTEGGVKCGERVLPSAKYCRKHILEDSTQVLFKTCGKMIGDIECTTPVEAIFDDNPCPLHMEIPILRAYDKPRKDSESDQDDSLDLPDFSLASTENVKTELMDYSLQQEIPKMETLPTLLFEESADGMDNQNLDVTGSDNMDIEVTDIPDNKSSQQNADEIRPDALENKDTTSNKEPSFLASVCVLDESKLEELDRKWLGSVKSTSNNPQKEHTKSEEEGKKLENISDHESYSKPAKSKDSDTEDKNRF